MDLFLEISLVLGVTLVIAIIARALKQPLIIGYILAGLLVGPSGFDMLKSSESMQIFSKIGIAILLFIVGLNLSPKVIKEVGKTSVIAGIGQVVITSTIGFLIARLLGIDKIAAMYVGIALTFSSTIIILKLLSDKGDLEKLHAKISIGLLLFQDLIASLILIVVGSSTDITATASQNTMPVIALLLMKATALFVALICVGKYVIPSIIKSLAKSPELLFLFSISWGLGLASTFQVFGFSVEIGALLAGVMLSMTPYAYEIGSRLRPLRDFFIVIFFVLLGSQVSIANASAMILPAVVLSAFVLIGNPFILNILMNLLGYSKRTAFLSGLTMAQISEFSLILATLGFRLGHVDQQTLSLITIVGVITITASSYLILHAERIYMKISTLLSFTQIRKRGKKETNAHPETFDIVLFGYRRVGQDFVKVFKELGKSYVVVDFDPENISLLKEHNIPYRYGDAEDIEFLEELNVRGAMLVVSTIPDTDTNQLLVRHIRKTNNKAVVLVISNNVDDAKELYESKASYVFMPHYLGAQYATAMISQHHLDAERYEREKEKHLRYLEKRIQRP